MEGNGLTSSVKQSDRQRRQRGVCIQEWAGRAPLSDDGRRGCGVVLVQVVEGDSFALCGSINAASANCKCVTAEYSHVTRRA